MNATKRQLQWRHARLRYWRRNKELFTCQGLTTRGTKRIYQLRPELHTRGRTPRQVRNLRNRIYRSRYAVPKHVTPMEQLYRDLRATIVPMLNVEDVNTYGREIYK